jgi:4-hydroxythreonine-4-phosphate dehydrogenase
MITTPNLGLTESQGHQPRADLKRLPLLMTMGDPHGVGPEVCARALDVLHIQDLESVICLGSPQVLKAAMELVGAQRKMHILKSLDDLHCAPLGSILVWDGGIAFDQEVQIGKVCPVAGRASIGWVQRAVELCQAGLAGGMVTAPISKEAVEPSVPGFQGHTEFIGEMCGDPQPVLALIHKDWVVAHVSTHVSLREACDRVTQDRIIKVGQLLHQLLKRMKPNLQDPCIGVAGLNPHAGENGLFGREEIEIIAPACQVLQSQGISVKGPLPADVVFPMHKAGRVDGVLAMYHDQGHVVTKTLAFDLGTQGGKSKLEGVNITLGLNVLRTSVDHGTGFDIAWQGLADCHSMLDALHIAACMSWNRGLMAFKQS